MFDPASAWFVGQCWGRFPVDTMSEQISSLQCIHFSKIPPSSAVLRSGTATGNVQVESVRTWCRYRMVTSTSSIPIALWNPERDTMFIQLLHPMLQFAWFIDYSSLMGCQCEPYNLHSGTPTHGHSIVNRCTHKVRTQVCQCRRCA